MPVPNLGSSKPNLGGPSGGPSNSPSGGSSGGPSGGSSGGPSGGIPKLGLPKLGSISKSSEETKEEIFTKKKKKKNASPGLERMNLINSYPAIMNKILRSIRLLFKRTFNREFELPHLRDLYNDFFIDALRGQITYLDEMISIVNEGKDPLNIERKSGKLKKVKPTPYIKLRNVINEELNRFLAEDEDMLEELKVGLRSIKEVSVLKGRLGFWGILTVGMIFNKYVRQVVAEDGLIELEVERMVLRPLFKKFTVYRNLLALILKYAHTFHNEIHTFLIHQNRIGWKIGTYRKGYFVNSWIRHRYKTTVVKNVDYANYIEYFVASFMAFKGQKSEDLKHYLKAVADNTFESLAKELMNYERFTGNQKHVTAEHILQNAIMLFNGDQLLTEYDEDGNIINQPEYFHEVGEFLEFLLLLFRKNQEEIIVNYNHVRFQGKLTEHPYEFLRFIEPAIRGMNVLNERILEPWF